MTFLRIPGDRPRKTAPSPRSAPIARWLGAFAVVGVALLAAASGCSGSQAAKGAQTAGMTPRDTRIVHEPCDAESSSAQKVDVNGDGRPDIIHVMNGGKETCRVLDLNLDGAVDAFVYYDAQGHERRRESDYDRDGRADEIDVFENGALVRKERETNFDDKIDTWDHYQGEHIARRERDSDGDGVIDQWWQFNDPSNPKCAIVASDANADGKPDPDSVVDLCNEGYKPAVPGAPTAPAAPSAAPAASSAAPAASSAAPAASSASASAVPAASGSAAAGAPAPEKGKQP
jgi:hypothetical protein